MSSYFQQNIEFPPSETCFNCMRCSDGDTETLSRCSKCKLAYYCSKLCLKEHYYKGHKEHCKYLSGVEKQPNTEHNERTCKVCKDMVKKPHKYIGWRGHVQCPFKSKKDSLFKSTTKVMSILLDHLLHNEWDEALLVDDFEVPFNKKVPLIINFPFETFGTYANNIDKALGDMFMIAAGLDLQGCEVPQWHLDSDLLKVRMYHWCCMLSKGSDNLPKGRGNEFFNDWFHVKNPLWATLKMINDFMQQKEDTGLWPLLVMKNNYIFAQFILNVHRNMDKSNKEPFVDKTANILDSFNMYSVNEDRGTWIDISRIKNFICTANTEKYLDIEKLSLSDTIGNEDLESIACSSCHSQVCIKDAKLRPDVYLYKNVVDASLSWRGPSIIVHHLSFKTIFYCGKSECRNSVMELYKEESAKLLKLEKMDGFNCEYCRKITENPHRCGGCEAKLYCSKECQGSDWVIHKKMCEEYKKTGRKTFDAAMRRDIIFDMKAGRDFSDSGSYLGAQSGKIFAKRRAQKKGDRCENTEEVD